MRAWISIGAGAFLAAMLAGDVRGVAAPGVARLVQSDSREPVDLQLVLAVDVSYSMDIEELETQREGYAEAIVSREFLQALRQGPSGRIAVAYVEWAGAQDQKLIVPWRLIDGPESADAVAAEIRKVPVRRASRTSISGVIGFAVPLFDTGAFTGLRRVIDVSGDGANNSGPPVTAARDTALQKGIVINGLPIMIKELSYATMDIPDLDLYYEDCVIGGPGSFVIPIRDRSRFKEAIRTKLVMEVAGRAPAPRLLPASAAEPRMSCLIGERIWQERWGGARP